MLRRLELHNFKAFERFTLNVRADAFLAGPNNAGKSTVIAALRASTQMLRIAKRRRPVDAFLDRGSEVLGFAFDSAQVALVDENLRHEFRDVETRCALHFSDRRSVTAVWPRPSEDMTPFFYLQLEGTAVHTSKAAADLFPEIGIVPILSPIDNQESLLTSKYVKENLDGRLASRHFRNQLWLLREESDEYDLDAFTDFARPWLPELRMRDLRTRHGPRDVELDLFYLEPGRRSEKEVFWAGDGIQIWLQLLLHVFRLREYDIIILDEPDVFLHPDLQRRLVRFLDSLEVQAITATHSPDVLAEAPPDAVVWVDRSRRRSISAPDPATLAELIASLGTQFNLRLARALRSKTVVFVEGDDMKVVRHLAEATGAGRVAREADVTVIPLRGFSNWNRIEPFVWLMDDLLERSVTVFTILDRDYRSDEACASIAARLAGIGVHCHVWRRKELESYLLDPDVLSRVSGAPRDWITSELRAAATAMETEVFARFSVERQRLAAHDHQVQAIEEAKRDFEQLWPDADHRLWMCPPKELLTALNQRLAAAGYKTLAFPTIARAYDGGEVPAEIANLLERIEDSLQ